MNRKQGLVFAALCLVWGSTWIAYSMGSATGAEPIPPLLAASLRFLLSAACCLPFSSQRLPPARVLARIFLLAATMIVFPTWLLLWGRSLAPSATVVVLYAAMPLIVILLTPLIEGSAVPARAMQASVIALGGLILATNAFFARGQAGGAAIVLLAAGSTAVASLLAQRLLADTALVTLTAYVSAAAGLLLGACSLLWERGQPIQWDSHAIGSIIMLAVIGGAPAYAAWFWLLQRLPAYQAVTVNWVEPLVALLESALLLRMPLTWRMTAGCVLTLVCLLIVLRTGKEDDQNVSLLST